MDNRPENAAMNSEDRDTSSVGTSLRSAGWVSLWSLGQLVVQFALQVVLAKCFGAGAEMDAFVSAIALPTVLSAIFVGSLNFALIPTISQRMAHGEDDAAWSTASGVAWLLLLFTAVLSAVVFLFAVPITRLLYPGFVVTQTALTAQLLTILAWLLVSNGLIAFSTAVLHCQKRFTVPAIAPVVGTGLTLALVIAYRERGIAAVAQAVLAGSLLVAALQMAALPITRLRLFRRLDPGVYQCLRLMAPLVSGAMFFRLDPLVDRYLASELSTGSIAHLGYAMRLVTALTMVATSGLAVVAFPNFARQHASGKPEAFCQEISHALRCLCVIMVPIVLGLGCYSRDVIHDLFERGEFTAEDTRIVALLLVLYLGMVVGAACGDVAAKIFFALSNTRTPTIIGCAGFGLGLLLKILLTPNLGVTGIAIATSTYYLVNVLVMLTVLRRQLGRQIFSGTAASLLRSFTASAAAVLLAAPVVNLSLPMGAFMGALVGAAVYLGMLLCLRDEMALRMIGYFRELIRFRP